jgi:hypothetical protein
MTLTWGALSLRDRKSGGAANRASGGAQLHTILLPSNDGQTQDAMTIRLADCDGQRNRANMLLNRMYSWRGYGSDHQLPTAPNCVTFTATSGDEVIGTLTLTVDSKAGLAADRTFPDEMEKFRRAPGAKLCELTKFAFDTSSPARPRLGALFHLIFIYGSMHYDCTDLFIEVNPRHVRFYEAMLGFRPVGAARANSRVNAPSQLMWLNVGDIPRQIDKHARSANGPSRSLYAHFFSRKEEAGIYGRLAGLTDPSPAIPLAEPKAKEALLELRAEAHPADVIG